jgi:hypothetical protein
LSGSLKTFRKLHRRRSSSAHAFLLLSYQPSTTAQLLKMCFGGREDLEAKKSREIDAMIHRDEKVMQKVVKLLLLGKPDLSPQPSANPRRRHQDPVC